MKNLSREEQDVVTKNQKHSSVVARVHYQKQHSRDIAQKGQECMKKLQGVRGEQVEQYIQSKLCEVNNDSVDEPLHLSDEEIPVQSETLLPNSQQEDNNNNKGATRAQRVN